MISIDFLYVMKSAIVPHTILPNPLNRAAKLPINTKSAVPITYKKLSPASTDLANDA